MYEYDTSLVFFPLELMKQFLNKKNPDHYEILLNDFDNNHLLDGLTQLVKSYYLAGAEEIMVSASPTMHWKRNENEDIENFITNILSIKNQPYRLLLGSAHQMGTARINPNPEDGVVDLNGKVHGLENVYIVDA